MASAGLGNLIKAPAVEGAQLSDATIARFLGRKLPCGEPENHLSLTRPAIGCFLSHLAVWRWVIASRVPRALVLEDDACPTAHYSASEFCSFVEHLQPRHQLVFPGCLVMEGLADIPRAAERLARLHYFNGTFSYLITPEACRYLLEHIFPLRAHIDHQMSSLFFEHRAHFQAYYANPQFFAPDWSLLSDCYVPLKDMSAADKALAALLRTTRHALHEEGRRLLPLANG